MTPAHIQKFISYCRVSTQKQGRSGLGLEAQHETVQQFAASHGGRIIAEFVETESGKKNDRPELQKALKRCRLTGSKLLVAKIDRLSRDKLFLMALKAGDVPIVAADMATDDNPAGALALDMMIVLAEHERKIISDRTKAALAAAKKRGKKLGNPNLGMRKPKGGTGGDIRVAQRRGVEAAKAKAAKHLGLVADDLRSLANQDLSLNEIARRLNDQDIKTSRGKAWTATAVKRALARL